MRDWLNSIIALEFLEEFNMLPKIITKSILCYFEDLEDNISDYKDKAT